MNDSSVETVYAGSLDNNWFVQVVSGLEPNLFIGRKENTLKGGFMRIRQADKTIIAVLDIGLGGEYYNIALIKLWLH